MMALHPHHLPPKAPPGSILKQRESIGGKVYRKRYYGPDGKPLKDREYTNHGNEDIPNPHDNPFEEKKKGGLGHSKDHLPVDDPEDDPEEGLDWDPETQEWVQSLGIAAGIIGVVGLIWTVANDVTGAGVADDATIPFWLYLIFG